LTVRSITLFLMRESGDFIHFWVHYHIHWGTRRTL
jgi:hypothetical protein